MWACGWLSQFITSLLVQEGVKWLQGRKWNWLFTHYKNLHITQKCLALSVVLTIFSGFITSITTEWSRGGRYQQEMIQYDIEYLHGTTIWYQTILVLPFPFPRKIEISAQCQKIIQQLLFKRRIMSTFLGLMLLLLAATCCYLVLPKCVMWA